MSNLVLPGEHVLWRQQANFLECDDEISVLLTGVGYGKSAALAKRVIRVVTKNNNWHVNHPGAAQNHLKIIYTAYEDKYLTTRAVPEMRAQCKALEKASGLRVTASTGRKRDGFFDGGSGRRRLEFKNGVDAYFYPCPTVESVVAVDAMAVAVDEVTMVPEQEIWLRLLNRVRDPRALFTQTMAVGTPEAEHWIRDVLTRADGQTPADGISIFFGSSLDNPLLGDSNFRQMGQQASAEYIKMQLFGEWVAGLGGQRFAKAFDEDRHIREMPLLSGSGKHKFFLGWDPGYATGSVLVFFRPQGTDTWWIYDEVVVNKRTTFEVCEELKRRGYNSNNVLGIGIDVDARKHRSAMRSSKETDFYIIKKHFGVTPKFLSSKHNLNAHVRVRLDSIDEALRTNRYVINSKLMPPSQRTLGLVNSIRQYALKPATPDDLYNNVDMPTATTKAKWAHCIDAWHYFMIQFDKQLYSKIRYSKRPRRK